MATLSQKMVFALIFCLVLASCKVYQNVDWINPKLPIEDRKESFELRQLERITKGDSLLLIARDSKNYYFIYSQTVNDSIQGLFWKFQNQRIQFPISSSFPVSQIEELKVRKYDLGTTLQVAIGIPVMVFVITGCVILYENVMDLDNLFEGN